MCFAEKYAKSVNSSNLMDDPFHHQTDALAAAAMAGDLGALLARVKYADGSISRLFEGGTANLASLLRIWTAVVTEKGKARGWIKAPDMQIAPILYRRVAEASLAHWLDSHCKDCGGTGAKGAEAFYAVCPSCNGTCEAPITGMSGYEANLVNHMVSELNGLVASHAGRAKDLLK